MDTWDDFGWAHYLLDVGFSTPTNTGGRESLPPIRVVPFAQRQAQLTGFRTLALGAEKAQSLASATPTSATTPSTDASGATNPSPTSASPAPSTASGRTRADSNRAAGATRAGGSSGLSMSTVMLVVFVLAIAAIFGRRRQVTIRKRKRARARATRKAMQRGTLVVADRGIPQQLRSGSGRPGASIDSHVRRVRLHD